MLKDHQNPPAKTSPQQNNTPTQPTNKLENPKNTTKPSKNHSQNTKTYISSTTKSTPPKRKHQPKHLPTSKEKNMFKKPGLPPRWAQHDQNERRSCTLPPRAPKARESHGGRPPKRSFSKMAFSASGRSHRPAFCWGGPGGHLKRGSFWDVFLGMFLVVLNVLGAKVGVFLLVCLKTVLFSNNINLPQHRKSTHHYLSKHLAKPINKHQPTKQIAPQTIQTPGRLKNIIDTNKNTPITPPITLIQATLIPPGLNEAPKPEICLRSLEKNPKTPIKLM